MNQARQSIYKTFASPDPASWGVYKMIDSVYPAFAKKLFHNNKFMEKIVMSGLNPRHILDYPICGRCETLAMPDKPIWKDGRWNSRCGCFADGCGAKTVNPITLRDWLAIELKKKAPPKLIDNIEYVVDRIAIAMLNRIQRESAGIRMKQDAENRRKMGLVDQYGNPIQQTVPYKEPKHHEVTLEVTSDKVDLDEEAKKIGKEEHADVRQIDE